VFREAKEIYIGYILSTVPHKGKFGNQKVPRTPKSSLFGNTALKMPSQ